MTHTHIENQRSKEAGFTLVELAVVMIIIGLLIGGILKGQELITNAQVASTVAQVKGIDGAVSTFQDSYQGFPGDFARAEERLPNCTAAGGCDNGNGDARLANDVNIAGAPTGESIMFWVHMNNADLLTGTNASGTMQWGESLPSANLGGGFIIGFTNNGNIANTTAAANARSGHYLTMRSNPAAAAAAANALLSTSKAARFDRKMDDGSPNGGTVRALGVASATGCADDGTAGGIYNEQDDFLQCSLAIRIQQ
jgi:prepilin-type N-terminal cleavage/methylation domain-containing protein